MALARYKILDLYATRENINSVNRKRKGEKIWLKGCRREKVKRRLYI